MEKIANFIVKKRKIIITFILIIVMLCIYLIPRVSINYDMRKYLPKDTNVTNGLDIMEKDFGLIGNAQIMVKNISLEETSKVYNILNDIDGITAVTFDNTSEDYYKNKKALFNLNLNNDDYSKETKNILQEIRDKLDGYDISMAGSSINANLMNETIMKEVPIYLIVAIVLISIILLLVATSWMEPILFLGISGIAILINYGSNIIFNEVSFVTFAIAALLQLALSMDYSIMLLNQYHHELKDNDKDKAMTKALKKSFATISSSSLTTIFGLLAMLFMSFTIGRDLGIVLAKGILINVLVVFLVFPALILMFDKLIKKTKKKPLKIPINAISKFSLKGKYIISIVMIILILGAYIIQTNLKLDYSYNYSNTEIEQIESNFGKNNQLILIYKNDTDPKEVNKVLSFLDNYKIDDKKVLNSVTDYYNTAGLKLNSKQLSIMSGIDENIINSVYNMYKKTNHTNENSIELINLTRFMKDNFFNNKQYIKLLDNNTINKIKTISTQLESSKDLLQGHNYNRMIINTNLAIESDETYAFYRELQNISTSHLNDSYILGDTALANDIKNTFGNELLLIMIITIISMILIIALTFRSLSIPIILVTLIQGAIWIAMCFPVIMDKSLFFLAYIIAQCIQMGATIDYAILLTSNYIISRKKNNKSDSIKNALKASILTIFTSASILIIATFTIAFISSQDLISTICTVIGRGTIVSTIAVLIILPSLLLLFDKLIEKSTYKLKFKDNKKD